ncbi:cuticle protein 21-like [Ischnura elegans]|uniref:cuticle protein 21-like n=1 Tax=Ischnura elegans TaxID=197161 RepID=UPI001ED87F32|nr:cuticle protein 21-like [Ischnura elegans]
MSLKLFVLAALVAVAAAGFAPIAVDTDYDPNPHYSYSYDVQDALTGDSKGASETRDGDVVKGSYNFLEADGTRRVVEYTADPVNGYNAVVRNEAAGKVAVAKVATPVAYHAPIAYHAPVAYHAPYAAYHQPLAYHTKVIG